MEQKPFSINIINKKENVIQLIRICLEDELIPKEEGGEIMSEIRNEQNNFSKYLVNIIVLLTNRHESMVKLSTDPSLSEEKKTYFLTKIKEIEDLLTYYDENIQARVN